MFAVYMLAYASCKPYIWLQKTLITQGRHVRPCVLPTLPEGAAKARETRSIFKPTTLSLEFLERSSGCIYIILFEMIKEWLGRAFGAQNKKAKPQASAHLFLVLFLLLPFCNVFLHLR